MSQRNEIKFDACFESNKEFFLKWVSREVCSSFDQCFYSLEFFCYFWNWFDFDFRTLTKRLHRICHRNQFSGIHCNGKTFILLNSKCFFIVLCWSVCFFVFKWKCSKCLCNDFMQFFVVFLAFFNWVSIEMGRHKTSDPNKDLRSIKQGLPGILRPQYRDILVQIITILSIKATKIANLASLLLLMMVRWNLIIIVFCFLN